MASDFTTHAGSISQATAIARGDLPAAGGSPLVGATGYATGGGGTPALASVPPDGAWANMLMSELANAVGIKGAVLIPGDNTQLATALNGVQALTSDSVSVITATTTHRRLVAASFFSTASGADSAVLAGSTGVASGDISLVAASNTCTASATAAVCLSSLNSSATAASATVISSSYARASGSRSFIAAGEGQAANDIEVSGDESAAIASYGSTASPMIVDGTRNAAIGTISGTWSATSTDCVAVASNDPTFVGTSSYCADLGSTGSNYATAISHGGSLGCTDADLDHNWAVAVGSDRPGTSPQAECIYGGKAGTLTWMLDSSGGNFTATGGVINLSGLPVGAGGLAAGDLWNNGGVVNIV